MDRYEHLMIEYYWMPPPGANPAQFKPSYAVFHPDGHRVPHEGGNAEITVLLNRFGAEGWYISSAVTSANWILWTLERKKPA
jgi:hypothetical protein